MIQRKQSKCTLILSFLVSLFLSFFLSLSLSLSLSQLSTILFSWHLSRDCVIHSYSHFRLHIQSTLVPLYNCTMQSRQTTCTFVTRFSFFLSFISFFLYFFPSLCPRLMKYHKNTKFNVSQDKKSYTSTNIQRDI